MLRKTALIVFLFIAAIYAADNTPNGNLRGKVVDGETHAPLLGVNIFVKNTNTGCTTTENGEYVLDNLPVGTYSIVYRYLGYTALTKTDVIIRPKRTTYLNVELNPASVELESVVVNSGYFPDTDNRTIGSINFSAEEIRRSPGTAGDVSRIMFSLPSIAKVNDQRNSLIVRGGSSVENSFYLDNIEIPNINHYPVQGSSDGPIGLLNVDFIKDVNFYSGGFSPLYGEKLSSIMELTYREGDKERIEPQVQMSMAGFGASAEGPIGSKGSFLFSLNKSFLDLIMDAAQTGGALPEYSDFYLKQFLQIFLSSFIS